MNITINFVLNTPLTYKNVRHITIDESSLSDINDPLEVLHDGGFWLSKSLQFVNLGTIPESNTTSGYWIPPGQIIGVERWEKKNG